MSGGYQGQQQQELFEAVQDRRRHHQNFGVSNVGHNLLLTEEMAFVPRGYCGSALRLSMDVGVVEAQEKFPEE
jgi:hypothetical protein